MDAGQRNRNGSFLRIFLASGFHAPVETVHLTRTPVDDATTRDEWNAAGACRVQLSSVCRRRGARRVVCRNDSWIFRFLRSGRFSASTNKPDSKDFVAASVYFSDDTVINASVRPSLISLRGNADWKRSPPSAHGSFGANTGRPARSSMHEA